MCLADNLLSSFLRSECLKVLVQFWCDSWGERMRLWIHVLQVSQVSMDFEGIHMNPWIFSISDKIFMFQSFSKQ